MPKIIIDALVKSITILIQKYGIDNWWIKKSLFDSFERHGFHIQQNGFYTPIPTVAEIAPTEIWSKPIYAAERLFKSVKTKSEWKTLLKYSKELTDIPESSDSGYFWLNQFFTSVDAIAYYGYIRDKHPRQVVEIGSGFSTHLAAKALRKNGSGKLIVIEPYPTIKLRETAQDIASINEKKVQEIDLTIIEKLRPNDVLFIDSSHTCKIGSDVNFILFEILPRLSKGVYIHFHDIFLPYEYSKEWVVNRNWFWNEQYVLLAYLMGNKNLKPIFSTHQLLREK